MTATYKIKSNEVDILAKMLKSYFIDTDSELEITVETLPAVAANIKASDLLAKKQIFAAREWEKSGQTPFKTMSIEELEAMIQ